MYAAGTRGDVQPMCVLGSELINRGHEVTMVATGDMVHVGLDLGIPTVSLGFDAREFLNSADGRRWLAAGDMKKYTQGLLDHKVKLAATIQGSLVEAARGADMIVSGVLLQDEASCVAELQGVPLVLVHYAPSRPNREFLPPMLGTRRLPRRITELVQRLVIRAEWRKVQPYINDFRSRLNLEPARMPLATRLASAGSIEIQAYSRHLVPELAQWDSRHPVVGSIMPTEQQHALWGDTRTDEVLDDWIDGGTPPVYLGFGSMPVEDPDAMMRIVRRIAASLDIRILVGAGWSDYTPPPIRSDDPVRLVSKIDHGHMLPRFRAAVHHGGSGTTAAVVRAGLPSVVCAVSFDQPFWGARLQDRQIGRLIRFTEFSEDVLIGALKPLLDAEPRARARALGEAMRAESAVTTSADIIENAGKRAQIAADELV